jgi:hypothetical protein
MLAFRGAAAALRRASLASSTSSSSSSSTIFFPRATATAAASSPRLARLLSSGTGAGAGSAADAPERERADYDVVIVGAGPAGLSAAIRVKQRAALEGKEVSVCVVEKGHEVGAHILSGNVFEPRALNELIPDWRDKGAPVSVCGRSSSRVNPTPAQHTSHPARRRLPLPPFAAAQHARHGGRLLLPDAE